MGGGLWLHHTTIREDCKDILTLLVPCTCENGYADCHLDGEENLLEILTELQRSNSRSVHDVKSSTPDCISTSVPRLGALSDPNLTDPWAVHAAPGAPFALDAEPALLAGLVPAPVVALHQQVRSLEIPPPCQPGDKAARHAALQADAVLAWLFPQSLYSVVPAGSWSGYPYLQDNRLPAAAIAPLGGNGYDRSWWLHYSLIEVGHDEDGSMEHTITLIAPCACGTYISVDLPDQDDLIALFDELDTPGTPVPCDWRLKIRRTSATDPRHASAIDDGPPF